ncbi:hypothetical protein F5882DRAFT_386035 [Hyaloscypha sp. PMI_1271]|nr:hypothetical protein F5882DRAFT_386035 [Hyaloscypha sp. PMI_1271]
MYWRKDDEHRERVVAQNMEASASNAVVRGENNFRLGTEHPLDSRQYSIHLLIAAPICRIERISEQGKGHPLSCKAKCPRISVQSYGMLKKIVKHASESKNCEMHGRSNNRPQPGLLGEKLKAGGKELQRSHLQCENPTCTEPASPLGASRRRTGSHVRRTAMVLSAPKNPGDRNVGGPSWRLDLCGRHTERAAKRNSRRTMLAHVGCGRSSFLELEIRIRLCFVPGYGPELCCVVALLRNCDVDVEFRGRGREVLRRQGRHRRGLRRQDDSTIPERKAFSGRRVDFFCSHLYSATPPHDTSTQQLQGLSRQAGRSHCKSKGRGGRMQTKMQTQRGTASPFRCVRCTLRLSGPGRRLPNRQPRARRIETSNKGETEGGNGVTTDQPEALKLSSQGQCKARQGKAKQGRQAQEISTRLSSTASDPALSPDAAQRNTAQHSTVPNMRLEAGDETRRDESAVLVAWAPDSQDRILGARCPLSTSL